MPVSTSSPNQSWRRGRRTGSKFTATNFCWSCSHCQRSLKLLQIGPARYCCYFVTQHLFIDPPDNGEHTVDRHTGSIHSLIEQPLSDAQVLGSQKHGCTLDQRHILHERMPHEELLHRCNGRGVVLRHGRRPVVHLGTICYIQTE